MNELSRHPTSVYQAIAAQLEQEVLSRYQSGDYRRRSSSWRRALR